MRGRNIRSSDGPSSPTASNAAYGPHAAERYSCDAAQATIVLLRRSAELRGGAPPSDEPTVYLFGSVHARMQRPVFPGDVLRLEAKIVKLFGEGGAAEGKATVDGKSCTEAEMYFSRVSPADLRKGR